MDLKLENLKQTMIGQVYKTDVVSNNLANANSTGFKRDCVFFEVLQKAREPHGGLKMKCQTDFKQGSLDQTDNPLDMAISGRGFFTIETPRGAAYTRNGHFTVDAQGYLKTAANQPVIGQGGWINLSTNGNIIGDVKLIENGEIYVDGVYADKLRIVDFADPGELKKTNDNAFEYIGHRGIEELRDAVVFQGKLESSNVDAVHEMVSLIEIQRQFESSEQIIRAIDKALEKTVSQVGQYT